MSRDDGYAAPPPGTYTPTRSSGDQRRATVTPSTGSIDRSVGRCCSWTAVIVAIADSRATIRFGDAPAYAAAISLSEMLSSPDRAPPPNRSLYSITAASPPLRTAPVIRAAATSTPGSGTADRVVSSRRCLSSIVVRSMRSLPRRIGYVWTVLFATRLERINMRWLHRLTDCPITCYARVDLMSKAPMSPA